MDLQCDYLGLGNWLTSIPVQRAAEAEADTVGIDMLASRGSATPCAAARCQDNPKLCQSSEGSRGCNPCAASAEVCSVVDVHMARQVAREMSWTVAKAEEWISTVYRPRQLEIQAVRIEKGSARGYIHFMP